MQRGVNVLGRKQNIRERYHQLKEGVEKYQVLQVGICTVQYDKTQGPCVHMGEGESALELLLT